MEPDVIRMYSSSPPPLDDAPEEEDEEFGDFGGFSGVASSVSFGEFDSPKGFGQSRAVDTHASPLPDRMFGSEAVQPAPGAQAAGGGRAESRARDCNRDIPAAEGFNNGFGPFDAEEAPVVRPKKRGPAAKPTLDCCGHRPVTSSTPAGPPRICSLGSDGPLHASGAPGGTSLGGMASEPRSGTGLVETSVEKNGLEDSAGRTGSPTPTMAPLAGLNDREWGESERGNPEPRTELPSALREQSPASLNGAEEGGAEVGGAEDECAVGPGTVSASVSDDFASFCQAVSPDGLEDFGDFNATGFAAPPFLEGEEPPADRTNEEGSSGDFGQTETLDRVADLAARPTTESTEEGEFGGAPVWLPPDLQEGQLVGVSGQPVGEALQGQLSRGGDPEAGGEVPSLKALLEPPDGRLEPGEERSSASHSTGPRDVWWRLQDIHDAFGLRYQWGGSHSNRALLCSLGIDNRSILFTGQKKQPVIVPAYAASLGMLEPTKDPASPLSAAEKTASIAQAPSTSLEMSTSPDSTQEALLPIQFDWSSSGLTNPLDGKLTTAKLETSNTSSLPDSFAHPISAVGKTCSSSRKHRQEGALSEEAARVMAALPDLSFMLARVVMFPVAVT
ncbi:hypothetical protein ANANG_G00301150 [Anguilla anguilla]|uniref:Aftiphilin clathrin-binding box domain-containing protein n=1 Tax=Anguilla anguilla TaxID=7936 RepID=A0A9D3LJ93_ANGAN|nr:hypothetical protein ANANG_G00301150 [Anguilla anguilla]